MLAKIAKITPEPIKVLLRQVKFMRLLGPFIDKYTSELIYQQEFAKKFKVNKSVVLAYWKKYRYLDEIIDICKFNNNTKVLDVGCGISSVLHFIKGERFGIDPLANEYLKLYTYPRGINIKEGFGEKIPFPDNFFDVVFCSNALDHTTNPQKTVEQIYRVLKADGYFILVQRVFSSKEQRDSAHPHCLTIANLSSLVDGFVTVFKKEDPFIRLPAYITGASKTKNNGSKVLTSILKK